LRKADAYGIDSVSIRIGSVKKFGSKNDSLNNSLKHNLKQDYK
jgi:hypothetical protein